MLCAFCGILLGGFLFPRLQAYKDLLQNGTSTSYSISLFECIPLAAAAWYMIFATPLLMIHSTAGNRDALAANLYRTGVHRNILIGFPVAAGSLIAQFTLTVCGQAVLILSSLIAWSAWRANPIEVALSGCMQAATPSLIFAMPLKTVCFACILSQIPVITAERFQSIRGLAENRAFFLMASWSLTLIFVVQFLWILILRR